MVICPGIGNHSEKHYIRTFVDYAQKDGYRCAVLNHLGALPNIELTSARMFTYGEIQNLLTLFILRTVYVEHQLLNTTQWLRTIFRNEQLIVIKLK